MAAKRMTAEQRAKVFKALSDGHRVAIVDALAANGPQCGTELAETLGISVALVSHHWEVLVGAGLIVKERVGAARYCTLDLERLREATSLWDAPAEPAQPRQAPKPRARNARSARNAKIATKKRA